ncbi:MAG TPA: hypothetical protein DEP87_02885 [Candidatus Pacebacteria bacterium]|nr:hypothetical protein [Candidatus Paceibacterota bacterium]
MNVKLMMVQSLDGCITAGKNSNIYDWTSQEDAEQFFAEIATAKVIVMGRQTYEANRTKIKLRPGTLRVVLTSQPDQFISEKVPEQLEFSAESPTQLVKRLAAAGCPEILLVGGSICNTAFLAVGLVTEIWLTIEPVIFGSGLTLCQTLPSPMALELQSCDQLNSRGTLLLKYRVTE